MRSALRSLVTAAAAVCLGAAAVHAQEAPGRPTKPSAIEFSPMSPFIRIYTAQYARRLTNKDELIIGGGYTNIKYDDGQSHAPTFIIGCRRYIWKKAHAEYQLWPSYNWYWEANEEKYYEGAELWTNSDSAMRGSHRESVIHDAARRESAAASYIDVRGSARRLCDYR